MNWKKLPESSGGGGGSKQKPEITALTPAISVTVNVTVPPGATTSGNCAQKPERKSAQLGLGVVKVSVPSLTV